MTARADPSSPGEASDVDDVEARLWDGLNGSNAQSARDGLFTLYLPFAKRLATRHFRSRGRGEIEFADLYQLACAGLLEAIDHFDPELGVPFKGYAGRRISGSILDGVSKSSEVRQQISFRNRVRNERVRSLSVADADGMATSDAMQALIDVAIGLALGFMLDGTGQYAGGEARADEPNAYESLVWKDAIRRMMAEVSSLPERDRTIVQRHYLDGLNFEQIGALLGVSKGRVSQLHGACMKLLRKRLLRAGEFRLER